MENKEPDPKRQLQPYETKLATGKIQATLDKVTKVRNHPELLVLHCVASYMFRLTGLHKQIQRRPNESGLSPLHSGGWIIILKLRTADTCVNAAVPVDRKLLHRLHKRRIPTSARNAYQRAPTLFRIFF